MASTAIGATGTLIKIATGTGGAKTISGVTVGNPTIITATAHGFSNGNRATIAALTGTDAGLLNGNTYSVQFVTTNTFAVAVDTTGKTITAGSGTATPITFTTIGNAKDFSGMDMTVPEYDITNFNSVAKEFKAGLPDPGNLSVNIDLDNNDAGQVACRSALNAMTITNFQVILPSGVTPTASFSGFVKKFSVQGKVDDAVRAQLDLRITGPVTWA